MSLESWESPDLVLRVRKMQCPDSKIVAACLCIFHLRTTLEHVPLHLTAKKRLGKKSLFPLSRTKAVGLRLTLSSVFKCSAA